MNIFQATERSALSFQQQSEYTFENTIRVLNFLLSFFASFLLFSSNPFLKISIPCITSLAEFNPVLQDPVLAIHPPCIYAGYVASAIAFSLCFSVPGHSSTSYPSSLNHRKLNSFSKIKVKKIKSQKKERSRSALAERLVLLHL